MISAVESPGPVDVRFAGGMRSGTTGRLHGLSLAPRFRGFQTTGDRRHPKRLANVLHKLAVRKQVCGPTDDTRSANTATRPLDAFDVTETLRSSKTAKQAQAAADRRRFLRRLSTHLVRILPYRDISIDHDELDWALHESPVRGQMSDISMNGVAFRLKQPLTVSGKVWLKLESRTRDFAVVRSAHIVRVIPASDTEWTVTCRFDHCVPYADVVQLSQQLC